MATQGSTCLTEGFVGLELRNVSSELRNLSLEVRNVSLELRNVSLELRNVNLELRNVSLELRNVSLELRNVSFVGAVITHQLGRCRSPLTSSAERVLRMVDGDGDGELDMAGAVCVVRARHCTAPKACVATQQ